MKIGDVVACSAVVPLWRECAQRRGWYIFRSASPRWAKAWFDANGLEAWFPVETRWRKVPGRRKREPFERPVVSGYVFCDVPGVPVWHEIRRRSMGKIAGVVIVDGLPRRFSDAELMAMRHIPTRLAAGRAERAEKARLRPGDVVYHPTAGARTVAAMSGSLAKLIMPMLGGAREVTVAVADLEKIEADQIGRRTRGEGRESTSPTR